ncbi:MAG TPA: alkaline phytoceramidase [Planctomycetota bacterium]|nr:alkaline phytoceramidase [Planctomycetota bacterium]
MEGVDPRRGSATLKQAALAFLALGSLIGVFFVKPIPQDPAYHQFADQRTLLGTPHALNVASNLPFLVVGLAALYNILAKRELLLPEPEARILWLLLAVAVFLTGFGSAYYHWAPSDATLFWDRLPMAVGFSALLGIMVLERVNGSLGRILWAPLLLAGVGTLLYWRWGGDLRFYGLLQGWAIVLVPVILLLFPAPFRGTSWMALALGLYALSKVLEHFDRPIYGALGVVSGHSLKHLAAAAGSGYLFVHLVRRRPL